MKPEEHSKLKEAWKRLIIIAVIVISGLIVSRLLPSSADLCLTGSANIFNDYLIQYVNIFMNPVFLIANISLLIGFIYFNLNPDISILKQKIWKIFYCALFVMNLSKTVVGLHIIRYYFRAECVLNIQTFLGLV